jgi:hypothetical protein
MLGVGVLIWILCSGRTPRDCNETDPIIPISHERTPGGVCGRGRAGRAHHSLMPDAIEADDEDDLESVSARQYQHAVKIASEFGHRCVRSNYREYVMIPSDEQSAYRSHTARIDLSVATNDVAVGGTVSGSAASRENSTVITSVVQLFKNRIK